MRSIIFGLLILMLGNALATSAQACPPGYDPCGRGVCCPR
jgi:hypothetical protein